MRTVWRTSAVVALSLVLLLGVMPAGALGAVTLTWDLDWGTIDDAVDLDPGEFRYPPDVATDKWGNVYVAGGEDDDHRIQMFDADGTFLASVGTVGAPSTLLEDPRSVACDRWGNVYVAEKGNGGRVSVFFPELYGGTSARTIDGTLESAIGNPLNISVGIDGYLWVLENGSFIQKWKTSGTYVTGWTPANLSTPGIGVAQDGSVYTTSDTDTGIVESVIKYDPYGSLLDSWGGHGTDAGQFLRPYDVGVDPLENVYVIESDGNRGQVFTSDGTFLTSFGSVGVGDGQFQVPYGIAVGLDRNVYVADNFNHRISKWTVDIPTESAEVAGADRYKTAVAASEKAYADGSSDYVVLATGENWPDAMGGAALAGAVDAPLLLTAKNYLPASVKAEIVRLGANYTYILGSEDAVSKAVFDEVAAMTPMMMNRIYGPDRYATANAIAAETITVLEANGGYDGTAFVATGENFPDALAASPIAAANGWPIYLTRKAYLPSTVEAAMTANNSNHGYILGSTDAVSADVATALEDMSPLPSTAFSRVEGPNRYATAAAIAEFGFDGAGMLWSRPALAVGDNFPDALAGGVLQGSDRSVLLLTRKTALPTETATALSENRDSVYELRFMGSTAAIDTPVRTAAMALLH